ncbi:hypothetical protein BT96DRAFT_978275 [Gymnopus androsaceus JB14]|uniref:Uncharacterized protein n=1 Tax=Gymnopus androsaceus JB14 TaxID=1447944 RepID=A0A6A4HAQ6_9AGAR|nr:hypothetical protein BT96DRAFT_978275 [Gymnopus androsaceus JB14]
MRELFERYKRTAQQRRIPANCSNLPDYRNATSLAGLAGSVEHLPTIPKTEDTDTETVRGSSPVSVKAEPKDCVLPPPKKKVKLNSTRSSNDIVSVKAEIAETSIPHSPKSKSHTSTLSAHASNENIPNGRSRASHVTDNDPPPSYATDGFAILEPKPQVKTPAASANSSASATPTSSLADLCQRYNIDPLLPPQQIKQIIAILTASHPSAESVSQSQSPSFFQPQLPLQFRPNQPRYSSPLAYQYSPSLAQRFGLPFTAAPVQNDFSPAFQQAYFTPASLYTPGAYAVAPAPHMQPIGLPDSFSIPSQSAPDPNTAFFQDSPIPDCFNSHMTPLQHLHVLEPLLNANANANAAYQEDNNSSSPFALINAFDADAVKNLLLPENAGQVMDRLLDEKLAEEDPFQASMGLVWMQRVGLIP